VSTSLPPARPYHRFTDDGRRIREVLSYTRRGGRFTITQAQAWAAHADAWVIPEEAVDRPGFVLADRFDRSAPLIVEIGSGVGEATAAVAAAYPDHNVLALEVWRPGVADTLHQLDKVGATNTRLLSIDAVWALEHLIGEGELAGLLSFFPDPWPKKKHHKRRLVAPDFAAIVASRLAPGAVWRLATDWQEYADQMAAVLDAEPGLRGGVVERWSRRPATRFERRGIAEGRAITDLAYTRVG
jgi:tRNA (guanine-N7-)-methyltransferase